MDKITLLVDIKNLEEKCKKLEKELDKKKKLIQLVDETNSEFQKIIRRLTEKYEPHNMVKIVTS